MKDLTPKSDSTSGPDGQLLAGEFNDMRNGAQNAVSGSGQTLTPGTGDNNEQLLNAIAVGGRLVTRSSGTAVVGDLVLVDNSGGAVTIDLPDVGTDYIFVGALVTFIPTKGEPYSTNSLTVGRNGANIQGNASDYVADSLNSDNVIVQFEWKGSTPGWEVVKVSMIGKDIATTTFDDLFPSPGNAFEFIEAQAASASSALDFDIPIGDEFELHILSGIPTTEPSFAFFRTSTDGGSTVDSGASDYSYQNLRGAGVSPGAVRNSAAAQISLSDPIGVGNTLGEVFSCTIRIIQPGNAALFTEIYYNGGTTNDSASIHVFSGYGQRVAAETVNFVRFLFSAGLITSGLAALYRVNRV